MNMKTTCYAEIKRTFYTESFKGCYTADAFCQRGVWLRFVGSVFLAAQKSSDDVRQGFGGDLY